MLLRCFAPLLILALGDESELPLSTDDHCDASESCALQALQHHASKSVAQVADAADRDAADRTVDHSMKAEAIRVERTESKFSKRSTSFFDCNKDTGGTCSWFGCSKSRGADCKDGKCQCGPNLCARNGKCQIAEGWKMASTTMQERDTGGSCRFFACDASRGPTHCDRNQGYKCFCAEGFYSSKGTCIPKLVQTNKPPEGGLSNQPFDWTKVDWTKIFQNNGWGATTDWSKIDWNKIYGGAGTPGNPLGAGYGYGLPYGQPGASIPPYTPPSPYAYANPYGVPYWR